MNEKKNILTKEEIDETMALLKQRFQDNMLRHEKIQWNKVAKRLEEKKDKLWALHKMEVSGGEPDVVFYDAETDEYIFVDCSKETPLGRRNVCYDQEALEGRKENKPQASAMDMADEMGMELLSEKQYRELQKVGEFDTKTSSWLETPAKLRKLGGAIFGDRRYDTVFVYHNGAASYYGARGFRGFIRV